MKLVTFAAAGRETLGLIDPHDETTVLDLRPVVGDRSLLAVIEEWDRLGPQIAEAGDLPVVAGARPARAVPQPRRDLFAVGKNYREHVAEFGRSGYDTPQAPRTSPTKPIVFSKATTASPARTTTSRPTPGHLRARLRVRARRDHRRGRPGHLLRRRPGPRLGLHDRQRRHRPRRAARPQAVAAGQVARHPRADGAVGRHRRRGRRRRRPGGLLQRQRRAAPEGPRRRPDLRRAGADPGHLRRDHAAAGRRHRHRHAGRRRHRVRPAAVPAAPATSSSARSPASAPCATPSADTTTHPTRRTST